MLPDNTYTTGNMIELLKSRRMVGGVIVLICICVIVMILEGFLAGDGKHHIQVDHLASSVELEEHHTTVHPNESKPCWSTGAVDVLEFCQVCDPSLDVKQKDLCNKTGWVEKVRCKSSPTTVVFRNCSPPSSVSFWKFELTMIVVAFLSLYFSHRRESSLEGKAFDRINKQVACGV